MATRATLIVLLLLSLTANATVALKIWRAPKLASPQPATQRGDASAAAAPNPATRQAASAIEPAGTGRTATAAGATASDGPLWARFETRDPAELAARLRAAGFSTQAAKAAVRALMTELDAEQRARDLAATPIEPFWKAGERFTSDREFSRRLMERERKLQALFPEDETHLLQLRAQYGASIPNDKLMQLSLLERDYNELRQNVMMRRPNTPQMPWMADELRVIEEERQRDLAALLSPAELEQFELRSSRTAQTLQRELAAFNPSEQEYREVFRLRSEFDQRYSQGSGPANAEQAMARRVAQQATDAAIKAVLGEQRFAEYTRSLDNGFQAAYAVTQRHGLGTSAAIATYEVQKDAQERAAQIRSDRSRTTDQRNADISALVAETTGKLTGILTENGMGQYRERAIWLRSLERTSNPAVPLPPPR